MAIADDPRLTNTNHGSLVVPPTNGRCAGHLRRCCWCCRAGLVGRAAGALTLPLAQHLCRAPLTFISSSRLPRGEFLAMVASELPFGDRTARRLMAIARHPRISNRTHASLLPPSWMTLFELTKLDDAQFQARLAGRHVIAPSPPVEAARRETVRVIATYGTLTRASIFPRFVCGSIQ